STPGGAATVASLVDTWVLGLTEALTADQGPRASDLRPVAPGTSVELDSAARATSPGDVVWVEIESGGVLFNDTATPIFTHRSVPFPITPASWIQPVSDEFGPLVVDPKRTTDLAGSPALWRGLDAFHAL